MITSELGALIVVFFCIIPLVIAFLNVKIKGVANE